MHKIKSSTDTPAVEAIDIGVPYWRIVTTEAYHVQHVQPQALAERLAALAGDPTAAAPMILDVRERWEVEVARVEPSLWIPMGAVPARLAELDPDRSVVVLCHHGVRSLAVAQFLERRGFRNVSNLTGGIDAWARSVDPRMSIY